MSNEIPPRPTMLAGAPLETPTGEAVKAKAKKTAVVVDDLNRTLAVKFLSPLDRMRLARVLGPDGAKNDVYMGYAALAYAVTKIDDEDVVSTTLREIEFLVERLGDEGLEAVGKCYNDNFIDLMKGADIDIAKN